MGAIQKKCKAGGDDRLYAGSYIDQRNYCIARLLETYSEHSWLTLFPRERIVFIALIVYHMAKPGGNGVKQLGLKG